MSKERCFVIGIKPERNDVTAVNCSAMEECRKDDEHFVVLQSVVDGYIEHVTEPEELKGRCICYVNEEGLLRGMKLNIRASLLLKRTIFGNLCITRGDSPDTFFTEDEAEKLSKEIIEILRKRCNSVEEELKRGKVQK